MLPNWDRSVERVCNGLNSGTSSICLVLPKDHMEC